MRFYGAMMIILS